jgi:hypothetical protein
VIAAQGPQPDLAGQFIASQPLSFKSRFAVMANDPGHAEATVSERPRIGRQFVRLVQTLSDREIGSRTAPGTGPKNLIEQSLRMERPGLHNQARWWTGLCEEPGIYPA